MKYGRLVATRGIAEEMESDLAFAREIAAAFGRYQRHDWGDLCQEDKALNDRAVESGDRGNGCVPDQQGENLDYNRIGQVGDDDSIPQ